MAEEPEAGSNRPYDYDLDRELFEARGWDKFLMEPIPTYHKIVDYAVARHAELKEKGEASKKKESIDARAEVLKLMKEENLDVEGLLDSIISQYLNEDGDFSPARMAVVGLELIEWGKHFLYLGGLKVEAEVQKYRKSHSDSTDDEELAEIREDFNRSVALAKSIGAMLNIVPGKPEDKKEREYPSLQGVSYGLGTRKARSKYPVKAYQAEWSIWYPNGVLTEFRGGISQFACEYLIPSMGVYGKGYTVEDLIDVLNKENENWSKTGETTTCIVTAGGEDYTIEVTIAEKK